MDKNKLKGMIAIRAEVYNVYNDICNGQPKLECLNVGCMNIQGMYHFKTLFKKANVKMTRIKCLPDLV